MIAAATLDRLRHGAYKIELDGESYRSLKPASEKSRPPVAKGLKASALLNKQYKSFISLNIKD